MKKHKILIYFCSVFFLVGMFAISFSIVTKAETLNDNYTDLQHIELGDSFNSAVSDIKLEKEFKEYTDSFEFLEALYDSLPIYYE